MQATLPVKSGTIFYEPLQPPLEPTQVLQRLCLQGFDGEQRISPTMERFFIER
jgi:hypothetical protein